MFSVVEETNGMAVLVMLFDDDDVDGVSCELRLMFGEEHPGRSPDVRERVAGWSKAIA